jgi:hypothetical protein
MSVIYQNRVNEPEAQRAAAAAIQAEVLARREQEAAQQTAASIVEKEAMITRLRLELDNYSSRQRVGLDAAAAASFARLSVDDVTSLRVVVFGVTGCGQWHNRLEQWQQQQQQQQCAPCTACTVY